LTELLKLSIAEVHDEVVWNVQYLDLADCTEIGESIESIAMEREYLHIGELNKQRH